MIIGKKITQNTVGSTYVVGDVHGCVRTFRKLVEDKLQVNKKDYLFLLGDYIDKGVDSKGVLDFIIELKTNGYQLFPLRGNHEEEVLQLSKKENTRLFHKYMRLNKTENLLDENGRLQAKYVRLFEKMVYFYELPQHLLVHAGFNFKTANPFEDKKAMLLTNNPENNITITNGKTIIYGHQTVPLEVIKRKIAEKSNLIPLDNGCVYAQRKSVDIPASYLGSLCAMCLDNHDLFVQENIEKYF
jgi:serine/threonine protein phosphatase 1